MSNAAATLEEALHGGDTMAAEPNPLAVPRPDAFRFTHVTGARPLDGYTIKRGVGVGGFGEVYYAVSDAGKEVALKRIQRHLDVELRGVRQCLNLKHLNLLSLFDIRYDDRGEAWVIMEYMLGDSLREVLERNPQGLSLAEVQRWFVGVASGVAYLHDHGIVHRDLKPGNIFDDQGIVKLGDYGLSKFISCSRRSGQTESVGTFHYMAPEIGRGSYGKEIDVYALGIVLYELLTGKVPFDGESSQEIIMKHLTADPDLSVVPAAYREPIRRALLKDPERRYRGVGEMLAALRWPLPAGVGAAGSPASRAEIDLPGNFPGNSEPLVIGEDSAEIVFGPVRDVVDAQVVHAAQGGRGERAAASSASLATHHRGGVWDREPIALALRHAVRGGVTWWQQSAMGLPIKLVILIVAGILVLSNLHLIVPLTIGMGIVYLVYFGIWLASGGNDPPLESPRPSFSAAHRGPTPQVAPLGPFKAQSKAVEPRGTEALRPWLASRSSAERTADTLGSFLMSFGVAAVLTLVALMIGGRELNGSLEMWTLFAWMLGSATAMAWTVLMLGKLWETRTGDAAHRRFVMLVAGLAVGLVGFAANAFLGGPLERSAPLRVAPMFSQLYSDSVPTVSAWLVHFGIMFVGLRWWRQADPLRSTRLSLWSVAVCGAAMGLLHLFLPLDQPWVILTGVIASVAIQLAAPWVHPQQRAELRNKAVRVA